MCRVSSASHFVAVGNEVGVTNVYSVDDFSEPVICFDHGDGQEVYVCSFAPQNPALLVTGGDNR